jgi:hypothetical protein
VHLLGDASGQSRGEAAARPGQTRHLPVLTCDKRLVGIISMGDMGATNGSGRAGEAVAGMSQPGDQHSQTGGSRI